MNRSQRWVPLALVFLVTQAVYLGTLDPAFPNDDSAETITAGATLGLQHPPGYALAALFGRLGSFLPLGGHAFRANWSASLAASLGAALLTMVLLHLLPVLFPKIEKGSWTTVLCAWIGGFALAFSPTFWQNALGAKGGIYHLGLCLQLALFLVLVRGVGKDRPKALAWAGSMCFLVGTGLANHWETMVVFLPTVLGYSVATFRSGPTNWARIASFFILGLSPLLYLPLRSHCGPVLDTGSPDNLGYFWADLTRSYYSYRETGLWEAGDRFLTLARSILHVQGSLFLHHLASEFRSGSLFAAAIGVVTWARTREKKSLGFIVLVSITLIAGLFSFLPPPDALTNIGASAKFLLPLFWMIFLLVAVGSAYVLVRMEEGWKGSSPFLAAGVLFLVFFGMTDRWRDVRQDRRTLAYDYGVDLLKSLPRNTLFFAETDEDHFSLYYLQQVEHLRPDVTVIPTFLLFEPWGVRQLERRYPELGLTASSMDFPDHFARIIYASSEMVVKGRDKRPIAFSRFDGAFHRYYLARYPSVRVRPSGVAGSLERPLMRPALGPSAAQLRTRDLGDMEPSLSGIRQVYALSISGK